jgi:opacity protein-like surface antigen
MKKLLIAAVVATISSGALAADLKPYVEGSIGYYNLDDVDTKTYGGTLTAGGYDFTGSGHLRVGYDNPIGGGLELGVKNIGIENLRIGASYQRAKFDMKSVHVQGTLNFNEIAGSDDGTFGVNENITSDMRSLGVNLDNSMSLYMLNAYYDVKNSSAFTPFVGFGAGMADIKNAKDNEFAWSASLGGKYNVTSNVYLGVKAAYTNVNGITDKLGIQYEDHKAYSGHALLGYEF